ncbi:hypothetical protein NL492_27465, partial [Klebsiella pneumoniae]|nr:hypothetical protein [Klebsiella pneumoniae]
TVVLVFWVVVDENQIKVLTVVLVFWVVGVVMEKPSAREFAVCLRILFCIAPNEYRLACVSNCRADR